MFVNLLKFNLHKWSLSILIQQVTPGLVVFDKHQQTHFSARPLVFLGWRGIWVKSYQVAYKNNVNNLKQAADEVGTVKEIPLFKRLFVNFAKSNDLFSRCSLPCLHSKRKHNHGSDENSKVKQMVGHYIFFDQECPIFLWDPSYLEKSHCENNELANKGQGANHHVERSHAWVFFIRVIIWIVPD